jgi:hypothetical protein
MELRLWVVVPEWKEWENCIGWNNSLVKEQLILLQVQFQEYPF